MYQLKRKLSLFMVFVFLSSFTPLNILAEVFAKSTPAVSVPATESGGNEAVAGAASQTSINSQLMIGNNDGIAGAASQTSVKPQLIIKYKDIGKADATLASAETKLKNIKADKETKSAAKDLAKEQKNALKEEKKAIQAQKSISKLKVSFLELADPSDAEQAIAILQSDPNVQYVQPNYELSGMALPQDPNFGQQWGLLNTGKTVNGETCTEGWDIGISGFWQGQQNPGTGITVAVLDTGIDTSHNDLQGTFQGGWDFVNSDDSVFDAGDPDHGTMLAGIIAAKQNDIGIAGIADNVKLLPLKFIENGVGYTSDAIEAIYYAQNAGARIINCSWGSTYYNPALEDVMSECGDILFVCSAGNNGSSVPVYPASFELPNVLSIGAVNGKGELTKFSNYGDKVLLAAPGSNILSTQPDNQYGFGEGTSLSAAFVTGIAALYIGQNPQTTSAETAAAIEQSARALSESSSNTVKYGIPDVKALLSTDFELTSGLPIYERKPYPDFVYEITSQYNRYSELSDDEKAAIIDGAFVRDGDMSVCDQNGLNLVESIPYAHIMMYLGLDFEQTETLVNNFSSLQTAENEMERFMLMHRQYEALQQPEATVLLDYLISGVPARRAVSAYVVAGALGDSIGDVLTLNDDYLAGIGDDSTPFVSLEFSCGDKLGHIIIEIYMELDDGASFNKHNCCFYIKTETGLLNNFGRSLTRLNKLGVGEKVILQ